VKIASCSVYRLRLPFRFVFKHAAAARRRTDNIIVRVVLEDGSEGFGEGVPREYVTGETPDGACRMIARAYAPDLGKLDPVSYGEAAWAAAGLRVVREGPAVFNSARCALELALLDAYGNAFGAGLDSLRKTLPGIGGEGGSPDASRVAVIPFLGRLGAWAAVGYFRLRGFRSFKVKLGGAEGSRDWRLAERLGKRGRGGRLTLIADANGSWTPAEAAARLECLTRLGFVSLEQPVSPERLAGFTRSLQPNRGIEITADESVRTPGEAERLATAGACDAFQVRLSKCGGLFPSLQVVEIARRHGLRCRLGAMVGETGILAAAQEFFLEIAPGLASVEPPLPRLLLRRDIVRRPPAFAVREGARKRRRPGLGVAVDRRMLLRFAVKIHEEAFRSGRISP